MMDKQILTKEAVRKIFPSPEELIFFDAGLKKKRVNLERLIEGVGEMIGGSGGVITYPTILGINNFLYQGRPETERLLRNMFNAGRERFFEVAGIYRRNLLRALEGAFDIDEGWKVMVLSGFNPRSLLSNSQVLYKERETMDEYLRGYFEPEGLIVKTKVRYYKPTFLLG